MAEVDIEVYSRDWYWVTGRGACASIEKRRWSFNPRTLVNQQVTIDNKRFLVKGVEAWAIDWRTDADWPIGLLVKPVDDAISYRRWQWSEGMLKTYEQLVAEHTEGS